MEVRGAAMTSLALWHWHIEISSKCTLKCPRCARTEVPDTLVNTELKLDFFKEHFTPEFIMQHVKKITFCGDDGDPIYAHDLINVIHYFKAIKPVEIVIVTNGSYKSKDWWDTLANALTDIDEIHFSLDGYDQASNEQYRVNSDWKSIETGIKAMRKSPVFMRWAAIAFAFNEDHLLTMQNLATQYGFDTFQVTKSTKFGKVYKSYPSLDKLQPKDSLISMQGRFTRECINLSGRVKKEESMLYNELLANKVIADSVGQPVTPLCQIGNKGSYISATGKLYPCCWVANRYQHNNEWEKLSIDLHQTTLVEALNNKILQNELKTYRWMECKAKCNSTVANLAYCTEW